MKNSLVDEYIQQQPALQQEICHELRQLVFDTFPDIAEEMKWGVPTYGGGQYYIVALKDHVNLGFSLNGLSKGEYALFDGGGKTMRHIAISSPKDIDKERTVNLLKLVAEKHE